MDLTVVIQTITFHATKAKVVLVVWHRLLREVKELIEALLNNKLPSSHIVEESLAIDENQFNLNLVVEKQIGDETRRFNISVEEVIPQDEDDEDDESDEDTTSYFTE